MRAQALVINQFVTLRVFHVLDVNQFTQPAHFRRWTKVRRGVNRRHLGALAEFWLRSLRWLDAHLRNFAESLGDFSRRENE